MADLVTSSDPDYASFTGDDEDFFLRVAGEAVRGYCGWHISPSITETVKVTLGEQGLIMLPSRHVTDVASVTIDDAVVSTDFYEWFEQGWIERKHYLWSRGRHATIVMTHGWDEVPVDLKAVVFELAANAQEMPSGAAKQFKTPGYSIGFESLGATLTTDQINRLSRYRRLGWAV